MNEDIKVRVELSINHQHHKIDGLPDCCPLCHKYMLPIERDAFINSDFQIQVIYQCTNHECLHLFIAYYSKNPNSNLYKLRTTEPVTPIPMGFDKIIEELSPDFVDIYNQANHAESLNLEHLAGIGLRKAFEFLIKDYAISKNPDKAEQIKKMKLSKCIKTYITNEKTKKCAERATWLGNDETHYVRIWETKDISDLKKLIDITVSGILNELQAEQYISEMPSSS